MAGAGEAHRVDESPQTMTTPPGAAELVARVTALEAQLAQLADRHRSTCVRLAALEDEIGLGVMRQ